MYGRKTVGSRIFLPGERVPNVVLERGRGRAVGDPTARGQHVRGVAPGHARAQEEPRSDVQLHEVTAEKDAVVDARTAAEQQAQQLLKQSESGTHELKTHKKSGGVGVRTGERFYTADGHRHSENVTSPNAKRSPAHRIVNCVCSPNTWLVIIPCESDRK